MSVASVKTVTQYQGNGSSFIPYPTDFFFLEKEWVIVEVLGQTGEAKRLVPDVDYFLSGEGNETGGDVVTSIAYGPEFTVTIARVIPLTQLLSIGYNVSIQPKLLEHALDKLTYIAQMLSSDLSLGERSIRFPFSEPKSFNTALPAPDSRKGRVLGFDDFTGEMSLLLKEDLAQSLLGYFNVTSAEVLAAISAVAPLYRHTPPTSFTTGKFGQFAILPAKRTIRISGVLNPDASGDLIPVTNGNPLNGRQWSTTGHESPIPVEIGGVFPWTRLRFRLIPWTNQYGWLVEYFQDMAGLGLMWQAPSLDPDSDPTSFTNYAPVTNPIGTPTGIPSLEWLNDESFVWLNVAPEGEAPNWFFFPTSENIAQQISEATAEAIEVAEQAAAEAEAAKNEVLAALDPIEDELDNHETRLTGIEQAQSAGRIFYETWADMDADTSKPIGTIAEVGMGESNASLRGVYTYTSGGWVKDPNALEPRVGKVEGDLNEIMQDVIVFETLGPANIVTAGSSTSVAICVVNTDQAAGDVSYVDIRATATLGTGIMNIVLLRESGGLFEVADSYPVTVTNASAVNRFVAGIDFPFVTLSSNERLGIQIVGGGAMISFRNGTGTGYYYRNGTASGSGLAFTLTNPGEILYNVVLAKKSLTQGYSFVLEVENDLPSTPNISGRTQLAFVLTGSGAGSYSRGVAETDWTFVDTGSNERIDALEDEMNVALDDSYISATYGPSSMTGGSSTSSAIAVFHASQGQGVVDRVRVRVSAAALGNGEIGLCVFRYNGTNYDLIRKDIVVAPTNNAIHDFIAGVDFPALTLGPDEYLGVQGEASGPRLTFQNGAGSGYYYRNGTASGGGLAFILTNPGQIFYQIFIKGRKSSRGYSYIIDDVSDLPSAPNISGQIEFALLRNPNASIYTREADSSLWERLQITSSSYADKKRFVLDSVDSFGALPPNWTNEGTAWSFGSGKATCAAGGWNGKLRSTRIYGLTRRIHRFEFEFDSSDAQLVFLTRPAEGVNAGTAIRFDRAASTVDILDRYTGANTPGVLQSFPAGMTFATGVRYGVEVEKIRRGIAIRLWEVGGNGLFEEFRQAEPLGYWTYSPVSHGYDQGALHGSPGFAIISGTASVFSFEHVGIGNPTPICYHLGDSISEGFSVADDEAFTSILQDEIGETEYLVSAIGGAITGTALSRAQAELALLTPRYVSIFLGSNTDGSFAANLSTIVALAEGVGAHVILYTVPTSATNTGIVEAIPGAIIVPIDHALTATGAGSSRLSALYQNEDHAGSPYNDNLHPNALGHSKMARWTKLFAPQLFE